jgi:hypothetical protein
MEHRADHTTRAMQAATDFGLRPRSARETRIEERRASGEMRRAALTALIALYPLIGSVTVVVAALLLAGGALAG